MLEISYQVPIIILLNLKIKIKLDKPSSGLIL